MTRLMTVLAAPALLLAAAPAVAAPAPAAPGEAAVDPARLEAARKTVDHVFPLGTYARMMDGTMDSMMDVIMDSAAGMPLKDLAGIGGLKQEELETPMGSATLAEIMAIYDPNYRERMKLSTRAMMSEMSGLMTEFEPEIRDGLAKAYAAKFDAAQLRELNAFFATPTGAAYAANSFMIFMDPAVMSKMQQFMPRMMERMPDIIAKVKTAVDKLPPPRAYKDLSEKERTRLAELLGLSREELDKRELERAEGEMEAEAE